MRKAYYGRGKSGPEDMSFSVRHAASASIVLVAFSAIVGLGGSAAGARVLEGTYTLAPGATNVTDWIHVAAGESLAYNMTSDSYVAYTIEVNGGQIADGGDGGGFHGCLASDQPFTARMRVMNDAPLTARESHIQFNMDLNPGNAGCTDVAEAVRQHDIDNAAPPGLNTALQWAGLVALAVAGTLAVAAVLWRVRGTRTGPRGAATAPPAVPPPPPPPPHP